MLGNEVWWGEGTEKKLSVAKVIDAATGELDDGGIEDEYQLESVSLVNGDFVRTHDIHDFRKTWEVRWCLLFGRCIWLFVSAFIFFGKFIYFCYCGPGSAGSGANVHFISFAFCPHGCLALPRVGRTPFSHPAGSKVLKSRAGDDD